MEFYCAADNRIKCDKLYSLQEFDRQLRAAIKAGDTAYFFTADDAICPCRASECPRHTATMTCPYDIAQNCSFRDSRIEANRQKQLGFEPGNNPQCNANPKFCILRLVQEQMQQQK